MEYKRRIFGFECDIYGHLNNASYLHIYEEARSVALEEMDFSIKKLVELGIHIYLVNINLQFKKAVEFEDRITIKTTLGKHSRVKAIWIQKIHNSKNDLCNIAEVEGVFIKMGKPYRLPQELYKKFHFSS